MVELVVGGFNRGDGDGGCGCAHRDRNLLVKAVFARRVKLPANKAFAIRTLIPAVLVWLWGGGDWCARWWWWWW